MDWDDLRVFLAIAKAGSLAGAARTLGVNHSTVFRRLNAFEERLGVRLFERLASGYALTVAGEEMQASALRVEAEVEQLDRRIAGRDLRLEGTLAVTTTDTLALLYLGPHLRAFHDAYPGIRLDLLLDVQYVNLSKRQADVAIRPTSSPPETLVGRRVAEVAVAPYAARDYLAVRQATAGTAPELRDLEWLMVDETLAHLPLVRWAERHLDGVDVAMRSNNLAGLMAAAAHGFGATLLPCFMGDAEPTLARLAPPIPEAGTALWLLTHEDLRHTARVRAFMDFMAAAIQADTARLDGGAATPREGAIA